MRSTSTGSTPDPRPASAMSAAGLFLVVAAFQAALAAGAPWGRAAYGGVHAGRLPARLRASSGVATVVYGVLAALTLRARSGAVITRRILMSTVYVMALGTLMNLASRSRVERALWTPVAGALTLALVRLVRDLKG